VKFNRLLSVFLVLLAIAGSGGDINDSPLQDDPCATQLAENAGFGLHEFRETMKFRLRSTATAKMSDEGCPFYQYLPCRTVQAQHTSFLQRRFEKTSSKLFIDFGTLLI
jgi:hypothetical protein